jgi:hypothetical protein
MRVQNQPPYPHPTYVELREKGLKQWDYALSNVFVHLFEIAVSQNNPLFVIPELNVGNRIWIEMHLLLHGERKSHLYMILEPLDASGLGEVGGDAPIERSGVQGDKVMLVDVPHLVESPKMFESVVRMMVRLKMSYDCDCFFRESEGGFCYGNRCLGSVLVSDGEAGVPRRLSVDESKLICEMVKGGTKRTNEVSHDESRFAGGMDRVKSYDMLPLLKVVFFEERSHVLINPSPDSHVQGVKVYLRPLSLELGAFDARFTGCHRAG